MPLQSLLVLALANMAISLTLTTSVLFMPFRERIKRKYWKKQMLINLISCPYCASHWVAIALISATETRFAPVAWVVETFAVVGMTALLAYSWLKISGYNKDNQ